MVSSFIAFAAACGGYSSSEPSPVTPATGGPSAAVTIPSNAENLGNRAYAPDNLSVDVGTTVSWTNTDSVDHTTTSDGTGWNSGVVAPGGRFSVTFQNAGTFPYHCTLHSGMVGTVVVR